MSAWQDIATAPKDGFFLAFCPLPKHAAWASAPFILAWREGRQFFDEEGYPVKPTHWMPLPEAPDVPA